MGCKGVEAVVWVCSLPKVRGHFHLPLLFLHCFPTLFHRQFDSSSLLLIYYLLLIYLLFVFIINNQSIQQALSNCTNKARSGRKVRGKDTDAPSLSNFPCTLACPHYLRGYHIAHPFISFIHRLLPHPWTQALTHIPFLFFLSFICFLFEFRILSGAHPV